ncbi:MAG: ABC transporter permease [Hyphomicrobiales bacterium]
MSDSITLALNLTAPRSRTSLRRQPQMIALRLVLPALFVLLWYVTTTRSPELGSVLPPPQSVLVGLWKEALSGALFVNIGFSLLRAFAGFVVAGAVGLVVGLAMSRSQTIRQILNGPLELLRPISSIAWIPLAILWFGIGFNSIVFIIFISCVFIVLLNTLAAATRVDPDLVKAALTLGASRRAVFLKVVIPSALPGMLLGLRIAMSGAWGGVLIAELISAQQGLGFMIGRAQAAFRPDLVIGGMVVIGIIGYALNALFVWGQRRLTHDYV